MFRGLCVLFAVSTTLCATPADAARALMLQPLSFFWNSPVRTREALVIEVPMVVTFDWRDNLAWTFELTPSLTHGRYLGSEYQSRKVLTSLGLTIREDDRGGFFATPKLMGVLAVEGVGTFAEIIRRHALDAPSSQFSIGADVGYEWQFERVVVAIVGGLSAGVGANLREVDVADFFSASLVAAPLRGIGAPRMNRRPVMDVNLNLLRVGVPF